MAGRNDVVIAAALEVVAQAVGQQPNANVDANVEVRMLETFLRNHPPTFKGRYDPDGAQVWFKEVERIFRVMCNALFNYLIILLDDMVYVYILYGF